MKGPHFFSTKRQAIQDAKQTVLAVVVVASIVISVCLVTTNFLFDLSRYKARVINEKETAVDTINANITSVEQLVSSFRAFEEGPNLIGTQGEKQNSSIVLDSLPSKYDFPALATSMELLVKRSGLRLEGFSGEDQSGTAIQSSTDPQPVEIEFSLTLIGDYEEIQDFIAKLQKSIRPIVIERIELSGSDDSIEAELDLHTFYQPSVSLDVETKVVK